MPNISNWNGYDIKDKTARELIAALSKTVSDNKTSAANDIGGLANQLNSLVNRVLVLEQNLPHDPVIISISAKYTGGDVAVGTALTNLTGLTVTANYSDDTTVEVTDYAMTGVIVQGSNTITVTYEGFTTTFTVTGIVPSILILNNRTLTNDYSYGYFYESNYMNPANYSTGSKPNGDPCVIADLTESSITVTENGAGGTGVSFPIEIKTNRVDRSGKTYVFHVDEKPTNARLRLRLGGCSNPPYLDITDGCTIAISEDSMTITVNGTSYTRTDGTGDAFAFIVFFFGSKTSTTTSYTGVSLTEVV